MYYLYTPLLIVSLRQNLLPKNLEKTENGERPDCYFIFLLSSSAA